ncbi:MAG TPA: hypothetical protein VI197_23705 [Polyangiaceae bacterium]
MTSDRHRSGWVAPVGVLGLLAGLAGACAGTGASQPATQPRNSPEDREVATGKEPTTFQRSRSLGHYSTLDGKSGVTLDRRTEVIKARLDGSNDVKVLAASGGPQGTTEYRSDDGAIWLRVDEHGSVLLFQGPEQKEGVEVVHDADAEPLD